MSTASDPAPAATPSLEVGAKDSQVEHPLRHLLRVRLKLGITQAELGRLAGYHQVTISHAEYGAPVRPETAEAIAAALGVTVEELCDPPRHATSRAFLEYKMRNKLLDSDDLAFLVGYGRDMITFLALRGDLVGERRPCGRRHPAWLFDVDQLDRARAFKAEALEKKRKRAAAAARADIVDGKRPGRQRGEWRECGCGCGTRVYLKPSRAKQMANQPVFVDLSHHWRVRKREWSIRMKRRYRSLRRRIELGDMGGPRRKWTDLQARGMLELREQLRQAGKPHGYGTLSARTGHSRQQIRDMLRRAGELEHT
jgi:transcriptional regulator with XRE-family HTH domain